MRIMILFWTTICFITIVSSTICFSMHNAPIQLEKLPEEIVHTIATMMIDDLLKKNFIEFEQQILTTQTLRTDAFSHEKYASIGFHPCEKIVYLTTHKNTQLWDTEQKKCLHTFAGEHIYFPSTVAFNKNGDKIVIASHNKAKIWNGKTYQQHSWHMDYHGYDADVTFHPKTDECAIATCNGICFWDIEKNIITDRIADNNSIIRPSLIINATGNFVLSATDYNAIKITNLHNKQNIISYGSDGYTAPQSALVACSATDKVVIATDTLSVETIIDETIVPTWKRHKLCNNIKNNFCDEACSHNLPKQPAYKAIAINPQGTLIALLVNNGTIHLWDAITARLIDIYVSKEKNSFPPFKENRIAFSPCGKILAIAFEKNYELWHLTTRSQDWLRNHVSILLASLIAHMYKAAENNSTYVLIEGTKDHALFTTTPYYVQQFLCHNLPIHIIPQKAFVPINDQKTTTLIKKSEPSKKIKITKKTQLPTKKFSYFEHCSIS